MSFVLTLWDAILFTGLAVFYLSAVVLLIFLEKYLIRRRSKGEILLPTAALVVAVFLSAQTFTVHSGRSSGLETAQIVQGDREVGHISFVYDGDRDIKAVGQFVTAEGGGSEFIDLTFDRSGKIVKTSRPIDCKEEIEEQFTYYKNKPEGTSLSYEELIPIGKKAEYRRESIDLSTFIYGGIWYGIPVLILFSMYFFHRFRRKKRGSYDKTRLQDL